MVKALHDVNKNNPSISHFPQYKFVYANGYVGQSMFSRGYYELEELNFIRDIFNNDKGICLDVGANVGNHTLAFSSIFSKVLAFEPNPICINVLKANVAINNINNVKIYEFGLGASDQKLPFIQSHANLGKSHFVSESTSDPQYLEVYRGDEIIDSYSSGCSEQISLIKIDVEGFEGQVLVGLQKTIQKHRPVVAFEWNDTTRKDIDIRETLSKLLLSNNYSFYFVKNYRARKVMKIDYLPNDRNFNMIFAIPLHRLKIFNTKKQ